MARLGRDSLGRPSAVGVLYGLGIGLTAVVALVTVALASRAVLLDDLRNYLGRTAETLAANVDGDALATLRDSAQTGGPEYQREVRPLRAIIAANPDIRFAYLGRIRNDSMFYVLDGAREDPAYVGEPDRPTAGELELWRTGRSVVEYEPTPTAWGEGIRAYAPVRDRGARLAGYVGVTMSAANYRRWGRRVLQTTWLGAAVAVVLASVGGLGAARTERARQAAEIEIRRAKQLADETASARGQFLANMSHEIRTPMNGVLGFAEMLERTDLDPKQRRYIETMRRSAESLLVVVNDILDFSKIEAGRLAIERVPFSVPVVVGDVRALLQPAAEAKGIRLTAWWDGDLETTVLGDPVRVRQVLLNLAGNAVKFTERGSVTVAANRPGGVGHPVRFLVTDTGIGLAPEQLQTVFAAFAQADGSTSRRFGGTGLGLAIARQLAELMEGRIGAASELGRGSAFWFEVPLPPEGGATA